MRVLILSPGADTGGQGIRIKRAIEKHLGWQARAMHMKEYYFRYPKDVKWSESEARRLYEWADVVHHKNSMSLYQKLDGGQRKPAVLHHQGTRLRDTAEQVIREGDRAGAVHLVSTVDLLTCFPDGNAEWLPTPYDLPELAEYRKSYRSKGYVRIAHSPTNRRVKSTERILEAAASVAHTHDISMDLIEKVTWKTCLSRKAKADIFVDQLHLGYGNNAVEAWAMGIPVICGVDFRDTKSRMLQEWGEIPFLEASEDTIEAKLAYLVANKGAREMWAERGRAHVERYHDEAGVAERLERIYRSAMPSTGATEMAPVNQNGVPV